MAFWRKHKPSSPPPPSSDPEPVENAPPEPPSEPAPPPKWQPGWVFAPGETDKSYRARLLQELQDKATDAPAALALMEAEFAKGETEFDRAHAATHAVRYLQTYLMIPDGPGRLVDVGGPSIHNIPITHLKHWSIDTIEILSIDYERDPLPYDDQSQDGVLLCEVIEHFVIDPMFCLHEINRVLKPDGFLVLTTPNTASWFAIYQALRQLPPSRWPFYSADPAKARNHIHAKEYLVSELVVLLTAAGFQIEDILTCDYGVHAPFCPIPGYSEDHRGDTIFARARKVDVPKKRFVKPPYLEDEADGPIA